MEIFVLILDYNESLLLNGFFLLNGFDVSIYKLFSFLPQELNTTKPTIFNFFDVFFTFFGNCCLSKIFLSYLWKSYQ